MKFAVWLRNVGVGGFLLAVAAAGCGTDDEDSRSAVSDNGPIILARCYAEGELDITERPGEVPFGCDGTGMLVDMTWTAWQASGADGTGSAHQTLCEPSCAAGVNTTYSVVVHAEDVKVSPEKCRVSFRYFSRLIVAYPEMAPESTDSTYNGMPSIEYDTTPICAVTFP